MMAASEPVVVRIPHRLGSDEAKRRIAEGLDSIRAEVSRYVTALDYAWDGYALDFRAVALLQTIVGRLEVEEEFVRVAFRLPRLLHLIARTLAGRIERRGATLLAGPKNGG
jgi:Putative polyhydroxyalkanoic acid system protein (PHA_gran_rgn)